MYRELLKSTLVHIDQANHPASPDVVQSVYDALGYEPDDIDPSDIPIIGFALQLKHDPATLAALTVIAHETAREVMVPPGTDLGERALILYTSLTVLAGAIVSPDPDAIPVVTWADDPR